MELSVLIPARNELWLSKTVEDVFAHARAETEVIVVCDGGWPMEAIADHPRLRLILPTVDGFTEHSVTHSALECKDWVGKGTVIGQRAATNLAAKLANGKYVMKLDGHCSLAEGFDRVLIDSAQELGPDVTQIPQMRNLQAFWRFCKTCNNRVYQGPLTAMCEVCKTTREFRRETVWEPRKNTRTEQWRFDHALHFQYWHARKPQGDICDVLSSVGACFFMARERFFALGGLDEGHGSWGQFGVEIACKSWLSGGRHVVNKRTWFAHMFRTQGGDFGFPYPISGSAQDIARVYSRKLWMENTWSGQKLPLSWLIEKFQPIPDWHDPIGKDALAQVNAAGEAFLRRRAA